MKYHLNSLLIILLFGILGIQALFHPGLFTAHDIGHQVARFYWYIQTVSNGQFPPYWVPQLASGLGYPLFFFSYHLPWMIGFPFYKLGLDIPTIIKLLFILSYILSGIFMYIFSFSIFKSRLGALTAGILYLWAPFHFLTILVSASMGTTFLFMFLPLILLGIYLITNDQYIKGLSILTVSMAGLILSHLLGFLFILPLVLMFSLFFFFKKNYDYTFLKKLFFGLFIGVLISCFYLVPAIYYSQFTQVKENKEFNTLYQRNFPNFGQFIYSKWGYAPIGESAKDGAISFQIGIAQWISIILVTILLILKKIPNQHRGLSFILLISYLVSLILMLGISRPFWDIPAKYITIDYPTRSMLTVTFISSLLSSILIISFKKFRFLIFICLIFIALYSNRNHIRVNQYTDFPLSFYLINEKTTSTYDEYLPKKASRDLLYQPQLLKNDNTIINQFSFPGQTVYINDQKQNYSTASDGRIKLGQGLVKTGTVNVRFEETSLIKLSKSLSAVGLIFLIYISFKHFAFYKFHPMKPKK